MTQTISMSDYYTEVQSIADDIREEWESEGPDFDSHGRLHETIDGHEYVIYPHLAQQVILHSQNDCAIFEELGPQEWSDWSTAFSQSAFFTLMRDVQDRLEEPEWKCKSCDEELDTRYDDMDERLCCDCQEAPDED